MIKAIVVGFLLLIPGWIWAGELTGTGDVKTYNFEAQDYSGSRNREYKVYVPKSYSGGEAVPMIMVLHGCAMDHNDSINSWNFDLIADANNVIIVYPFITSFVGMRNENCWGYWFDNEIHEGEGEVADLTSIGKEVESKYNINPAKRYITGISSGGGMTVAAAIAYNEYWAAAAPVAGLPYDDWSVSVTNDMFQSLSTHVTAIKNELDDDRAIPLLIINSKNDEVVNFESAQLVRDSHLEAFGIDKNADEIETFTEDGITGTMTKYNDSNGDTIVQTYFYNGLTVGPRVSQNYGAGHYWAGDDRDYNAWTWDAGPSNSEMIWDFFKNKTLNGYEPEPKAPVVIVDDPVINGNSVLLSGNVSDPDGEVVEAFIYVDFFGIFNLEPDQQGNWELELTELEDELYEFYVGATDNDGRGTASDTLEFRIGEIPNELPELSVSEPTVSTLYGTKVTINAEASDSDGEIVSVTASIDGGTLIELSYSIYTKKYSASVSDLEAGDYSVVVTATDDLGGTTTATTSFSIEPTNSSNNWWDNWSFDWGNWGSWGNWWN